MTPEPGGAPPSPPPLPPAMPPRPSPRWSANAPPGRRPSRPPGRPPLIGILAVALAGSLAVNAILALRVKDESDKQASLRAQVSQLQAEVDSLRQKSPPGAGSIFDQVAAAAAKIRELTFKTKVPPEVLTDAQLRARVAAQFAKDNPRAAIEDVDAVLTTLGLLGPNDDLYKILLGVQTEQVGGYYDTATKKLVVGGDATNPSPLARVLLEHEFVHALTDQHFDLTRIDRLQAQHKDDESLAFLSLAEGDATVSMFEYAGRYLTPTEQQDFTAESAATPSKQLDAAPKVVQRSLLFPYEEGVQFVRGLIQEGGLAAVDKAYQDPPTSTEQILHIAKYTGVRDDPTPVTVPDLARTMGSGWKTIQGGGIGEFDVRLIVNQFLTKADAERAGAGWDGGRYAAARSSSGVVVAALTAWDSETEAREATEILGRWLPSRYANQGGDFRLAGATGRGWESPSGAGAVLRSGSRVVLILGPDQASVEKARTAFAGF